MDAHEMVEKLNAQYEELNKVSPSTAVHLSTAHLHSDAVLALSQASGCLLEATLQAMVFLGHSIGDNQGIAYRHIESPEMREEHEKVRFEFLALTEDLVAHALKESCGCKGSDTPAPFLGDSDSKEQS